MGDFLVVWDNTTGFGDYAIEDGDFAGDATLDSDVYVSLFTDRVADASDTLPPGQTDRRGWWGDTAFVLDASDSPPDRIGSKFWLRVNALLTPATLAQLSADAYQALYWMVEDGVAQQVTCTTAQTSVMAATLVITIARQIAGQVVNTVYDAVWNQTLGLTSLTRRVKSA